MYIQFLSVSWISCLVAGVVECLNCVPEIPQRVAIPPPPLSQTAGLILESAGHFALQAMRRRIFCSR